MNPILAEKLSLQVLNQLPEFLRADSGDPTASGNYQTFIAFLQAYYEFMEQDSEAQYVIQNARSYADVDNTIDLFVDKFLEEFAYDLPGAIFTNQATNTPFVGIDEYESKRAVAKKIAQAYSSKGSEAAIKLLFRLLFDDEITFYYPKDDILKPSDGVWVEKQTLKVYDSTGNVDLGSMEGHIITGASSGATAVIDEIFNPGAEYPGLNVYEYKLEKGTINGTFTGNETITFSTGNLTTGNIEVMGSGTLLNVVAGFTILDPGYGYSVNEPITVNGSGSSFSGKVSAVNSGGKIKAITFTNFGANYTTLSNASIGLPATIKNGKFDLASNVITAVLIDATGNSINHGLKANDTINVSFTSGLASSYNSNYTVISVPSTKKIRFGLANSATLTGNLTINSRQANLIPIPGALCNYDGVYTGVLGQPDNQIVIQDSYYYQDYSYVIRTTKQSLFWKDIVKKVLHPAGMELFPEVYLSTASDTEPVYAGIVDWQTYILFIQILLGQVTLTPRLSTQVEVSVVNRAAQDLYRYRIGSTLNTLDQFKFLYEDLAVYDVGNVTIGSTQGYTPSLIAPPSSLQSANLNSSSNIILNSNFIDSSAWILESGWTITAGNASATAATSNIYQANLPITNRAVYACNYDITSRSSGNIRIQITAGDYSNIRAAKSVVGTYRDYFFINSSNVVTTANIYILGNAFTGTVDNITANLIGNWDPSDPALGI